jgi:hypothetical protein
VKSLLRGGSAFSKRFSVKYIIHRFILVSLAATPVWAESITIDDGVTHVEMRRADIWLAAGRKSIGDARIARFAPAKKTRIKLGKDQSVWLRSEIISTAAKPLALVVRHEFAWTDEVEFFVLNASGETVAYSVGGDSAMGPRLERMPLVRFEIVPRERLWLYANITTVAQTSATLHLYTESFLAPRVFAELLAQGLFAGIAFMLIVFHLNLYRATRDDVLSSYLAYLVLVTLLMAVRTGILPQMFVSRYAHLADVIGVLLVSASYYAGVRFARAFFSLRTIWPGADRMVFLLQLLTLVPAIALVFGRREAYTAANLAGLLVGPPLLALGVRQAFKTPKQSSYFVVGYSLPIIAIIVDNAVESGFIGNFAWRNEMLPAATALEFLLFSLVIYRKLADSEISRSRDKEHLSRMRAELGIARSIQKSLIPPLTQNFANVKVHAAHRSEKEVGSDFFDVVANGANTIGVLVTDTGGLRTSSLASALDASAVRMAFRNCFAGEKQPSLVVQQMLEMLQPVTGSRPIAITYAVVDTITGTGKVYCHANPPPLLVRRDHSREELMELDKEKSTNSEIGFSLKAGEHIVIFTAGLGRRTNLRRDRLTPEQRIQKIQNRPERKYGRHRIRQREDLTLVAISFSGESE